MRTIIAIDPNGDFMGLKEKMALTLHFGESPSPNGMPN